MSHVFYSGNGYLVVDGQVVERDALRVAESLKEYAPEFGSDLSRPQQS